MQTINLLPAVLGPLVWLATLAVAQQTDGMAERAFGRLDRDHDGVLSQQELPTRAQQLFPAIDLDRDGSLSRNEFANGLQMLRSRANPNRRQVMRSNQPAPEPYQFYGSANDRLDINQIQPATLKWKEAEKPLQLRITFPKRGGPYPVIVFSHGLFGSNDNYLMLTEFWASHGYVVIQPNHPDSMALGTRLGDFTATRCWAERPQQVSAVFESIEKLVKQHPELTGKLNAKSIGVAGHSFGAGTANLLAGAKVAFGRWGTSLSNPQIKGALLMSPQGEGDILNRQSWDQVKTPLMVMTGSKDESSRTQKPPSWRRQPYEYAPAGDKYLVWIKDLEHGFGDITGSHRHEYNPNHIAYTLAYSLMFWDHYLKDSQSAGQLLQSQTTAQQTDGNVTYQFK